MEKLQTKNAKESQQAKKKQREEKRVSLARIEGKTYLIQRRILHEFEREWVECVTSVSNANAKDI